jgi:nicotinate-nucleotide adenylyltransferase
VNSVPQRIGIFGGSFDPIHNTHCGIARAALREAALDRVYFVVAGQPPHKGKGTHASAQDRLAMVRAAIKDQPNMEVSTIEIDRNGPSYTADTLEEFGRRFPGARLFLIIGLDSLKDLPRWRRPDEIVALARLLVAPRPGLPRQGPPELEGCYDMLPFEEEDISSTEVRERIQRGEPLEDLVPAAVAEYIRGRAIYHDIP